MGVTGSLDELMGCRWVGVGHQSLRSAEPQGSRILRRSHSWEVTARRPGPRASDAALHVSLGIVHNIDHKILCTGTNHIFQSLQQFLVAVAES